MRNSQQNHSTCANTIHKTNTQCGKYWFLISAKAPLHLSLTLLGDNSKTRGELVSDTFWNYWTEVSDDTMRLISMCVHSWWRHQMKTFSALLAICARNSPVPSEFPTQKPVTRCFDVFFDLRLNTQLSKESWGWWLGTQSHHYEVIVMYHCCWKYTSLLDSRGFGDVGWTILCD